MFGGSTREGTEREGEKEESGGRGYERMGEGGWGKEGRDDREEAGEY